MTPHHRGWNDGKAAPTDFDGPVPVPYLAVTGRFRVGPSPGTAPVSDAAREWSELALSLLTDALNQWGIGGKTTSGYGRLVGIPSSPDGRNPAGIIAKPLFQASDGLVEVRILEAVARTGPNAFRVQEEGKPKGVFKIMAPRLKDSLRSATK